MHGLRLRKKTDYQSLSQSLEPESQLSELLQLESESQLLQLSELEYDEELESDVLKFSA